jgi:4-hydroxy-L-threonine phosphate dehydrogenase PdxA
VRTIALTIGDPNGIGPEIAAKAAALERLDIANPRIGVFSNLPARRPKVAGAA